MGSITGTPPKLKRQLLPANFKIKHWEQLEPFYKELASRTIQSTPELEKWMADVSEMETVLNEDLGWRYIRMTCDTTNKKYIDAYTFFIETISNHVEYYTNLLNQKLIQSPFINKLNKNKYHIYVREIKNDLKLFREENIPLYTKLNTEEQKYGAISGNMSIKYKGKEITLQQAAVYLKNSDRKKREEIYLMIQKRRMSDAKKIDTLFDKILTLRQQIAANAGFKNYRDYAFKALGRFDYSINDCFNLHEAIKTEVIPLLKQMDEDRKKKLNLHTLKPWDMDVDTDNAMALHPFKNGKDLIDKSIECFNQVKPFYAQCLKVMKAMNRLDVDSRKGKAPGGYNYSLNESGVPFIFMNAAGVHRDMVTIVHEGGHAIHAFLTNKLKLDAFKNCPSEVAELASMSMELISMEHWDVFFNNPDDLRRARKEQLEKIIYILPWIAVVDKFQHWIYENKLHTVEQRRKAWLTMLKEFSSPVTNWEGQELFRSRSWQNQMHIFDAPFYYIEYAMAQLGAIAIWKNYKHNPKKALNNYEAALKLGYTKSIPEIYAAAGIKFDFSKKNIRDLINFVKEELRKLS